MSMDINELKAVGKDVETKKVKSEIQALALAVVKSNTKAGQAVTQKEVAEILTKQLKKEKGDEIRPQHARSALLALRKKGKVVRRIMDTPDEKGNTHFWYAPA